MSDGARSALCSRCVLGAMGVALVLAPLAASSAAQDVSDETVVEWEPLPGFESFNLNDAEIIGFPLVHPDRTRLLAGGGGDIYFWGEGEREWEEVCAPAACRSTAIAVRDSVIITGDLAGPGSGGALSLDGGRTWTFDMLTDPNNSVSALLWSTHPDTDGSLYLGDSFRIRRSDDLGREGTYTTLGLVGGQIEDLAEVPPSAVLPSGRILAAVWNGLSLSDDGGQSFRSSNVYRQGGLIGTSLAVHPDPTHPYGAVAYAAVILAGEDPPFPALFRSDDGGETWEETARVEPGDFGVADPDEMQLLATSDGVLWVGVFDGIGGRAPSLGVVLRSTDGGETLEAITEGWGGFGVYMLAESPDGRVYAATDSLVWRTVDPVVAVANTPEAPEPVRLGVRVEPNPVAGRAVVQWQQTEAGTARVTVHDARGREVLVATDRRLGAGDQSTEVDTSGLAPGVYLVRVVTEAGAASARLTVAR
ncbi:MAG: T9SS type A sorting domain-containing protein [Bacteroidota bacterium]